jgi:hypothetical protein
MPSVISAQADQGIGGFYLVQFTKRISTYVSAAEGFALMCGS